MSTSFVIYSGSEGVRWHRICSGKRHVNGSIAWCFVEYKLAIIDQPVVLGKCAMKVSSFPSPPLSKLLIFVVAVDLFLSWRVEGK